MTPARKIQTWLLFASAACMFVLPLFVHLREPELRNDEAIYSYAVDRILETGDWLTPRSIPSDGPFFEKPPLKFWIVAAGMRTGLVSRDDAGMRWFDALFGAIAFVYIFRFGVRLGGAVAGFVALFMLFTLSALVFEHGLRTNNMEAALFLSYAGGLWHFVRWREQTGRSRLHAVVVALYFALGFMTKFVAVAFLPIVMAATLLWDGDLVREVRARWRDWLAPAGVALLLILPWFVYQTIVAGPTFWEILLDEHVYKRFTAFLDPAHLHPWHYYFTYSWGELGYAGSRLMCAAGLIALAAAALRGRPPVARLVFLWALLPTTLISLGTSKLGHYVYPYWPPIGLGAGYLFSEAVGVFRGARLVPLAGRFRRSVPERFGAWLNNPRVKRTFAVVAMVAVVVAILTAVYGPVRIDLGGVMLFRNSSVLRALVIGAVFQWLSGYTPSVVTVIAAVVFGMLLLPFPRYFEMLERLHAVDHPIRAARDCAARVQADQGHAQTGVLFASGDLHHAYYYYLHRLGPWVGDGAAPRADVLERLTNPDKETPIVLSLADYRQMVASAARGDRDGQPDEVSAAAQAAARSGVAVDDRVAMIFPGDFTPCVAEVLGAGGRTVATDSPPQ
jgi:4-amino-4-deoxy-L-arabinose transferase-like glycosyltransferase